MTQARCGGLFHEITCFSYMKGFCNPVRLHYAIEHQSPICYERLTAEELLLTQ
jgi:hypothetical protein